VTRFCHERSEKRHFKTECVLTTRTYHDTYEHDLFPVQGPLRVRRSIRSGVFGLPSPHAFVEDASGAGQFTHTLSPNCTPFSHQPTLHTTSHALSFSVFPSLSIMLSLSSLSLMFSYFLPPSLSHKHAHTHLFSTHLFTYTAHTISLICSPPLFLAVFCVHFLLRRLYMSHTHTNRQTNRPTYTCIYIQ